MVMSKCPQCGAEIPGDSARLGLCPQCLLRLGIDDSAPDLSTLTWTSQQVQAGERFGPYRVVRLLGEGGMGVVYLAEQEEPIRRRVALKLIRIGMDTAEVIARFDSERQALALMDHPNIARVFDAGVSGQGRPYFVMEYVAGVPITKYCDAHRLTNRQRLELFRPVCMAIQHAHQKGIIHRDIKPSNILIAVVDGQPTPKVIDFGVAKAINQRLTEKTVFTQIGFFIGTPEYISPEQAEVTSLDVDTTTDIYSLGVVLYELLVGVLPFDPASLRKAGYDEIRRILREEEPPTPTARLHSLGAAATSVAERRHADAESLEKQLRGDLDWITMKAMDKDQSRRYPSASEFAADMGRYLRDEPVLAGPPERRYRIRKFLRRHRRYAAAAASILISLLLGLTATTVLFFRAESARREAQRQGDIARQQSYVANLVAADLHLRSNEFAEARRRLLSCPTDLRHWEWRRLFLQSDFSLATLYTLADSDHDNLRLSLAFSEDGSRIYSTTQHTLYSWDAATYLPVGRWSGFGSILAVTARADQLVAKTYTTGGLETDHTLRVFDSSRRQIATFGGHENEVSAAAFSPDGARVVSGDRAGVLFIWDAASGKAVHRLTGSAEPVIAAAFSQDGKRIVVAFGDGTVRLWEAAGGASLRMPEAPAGLKQDRPFEARSMTVAFSPDAHWLAASSGRSVRLWETASGGRSLEIGEFRWPIRSLAFNADGSRILAGTDEGSVHILDRFSGKPLGRLVGHESAVLVIAFHPGGRIVTADRAKIRVWDPSSFEGIETLPPAGPWVNSIAFNPNGRLLASANSYAIRLWDVSSRKELTSFKLDRTFTSRIAFSPDGTYLACTSGLNAIYIFDVLSGAQSKVIRISGMLPLPPAERRVGESRPVQITSISFSPDGSRIASGSNDGAVRFWDVATGREVSRVSVTDSVNSVAFSPDGRRVATASGDVSGLQQRLREPAVRVWDVDSGKLHAAAKPAPGGPLPAVFSSLASARDLVYSRDGTRIASLHNYAPSPMVWDAASGAPIVEVKGPAAHFAMPLSITFHPDGRRLFTSWGHLVQISDASSGEPLLLLQGHEDRVAAIAISPDGSRLASGAMDGTVRIWDTRSAYDPEADSLVRSLFSKLHFAGDVTAALRADPNVDETVRRKALLLIQQQGEQNPNGHIAAAWEAARNPRAGRGVYDSAWRHARVACELAPWDWEAWNAQGGVHYRRGAHRHALSSLLRAAEVRKQPSISNLAFQALAYSALGETAKARSAFAEAKRLLERPETMMEPELVALVQEAASVLDGKKR
jgi:WD40 repeat protein/predicted Ser/Thr protein kinase